MKKTLRIITGSLSIGGTEKHLSMVMPLLAQRGWNIKIITLEKTDEPNLMSLFHAAGITVVTPVNFQIRFLPKKLQRWLRITLCFLGLWKEFRRDRVTLTHFFLPHVYLIGMFAASVARLSAVTVMSRRALNFYQKGNGILRWLELRYHRKVKFILANSDRVIAQLQHDERVKMQKLKKIYNGVDVSRYANITTRNITRAHLGIGEGDLVFIIVANLIRYKAHQDLLRALYLIQQHLPPRWRLLCVGRDSGILMELRSLTQDLKLAENVSWLGVREDIPDLLAAADIGVLCSHEEGFSNAILEGMAAGLPMVVTDVGGNAEAVVHDKTGLVVPAKNPPLLAQALLKLAENKTLAKAMGVAGQTRVYQHFSLQACAAAYEKFYHDMNIMFAS